MHEKMRFFFQLPALLLILEICSLPKQPNKYAVTYTLYFKKDVPTLYGYFLF